jgi:cobalt-zinc-cadmium efflux system membrane fusion protein
MKRFQSTIKLDLNWTSFLPVVYLKLNNLAIMQRYLFIIALTAGLTFAGCSSDQSHKGEDAHTHESEEVSSASSHTEEHGHPHQTPENQKDENHSHNSERDHSAVKSGHDHEGSDSDQAHESSYQRPKVARITSEGGGAVTFWTDDTELFMEYPDITVGSEVTFAVHLTRLSDFAPISDSKVTFVFESPQGTRKTVSQTQVQIPGIYGPDITFDQAGRYNLTILMQGMVRDTIAVEGIPVYASSEAIPNVHQEEDPNLVTFLKEQQWKIPFGTQEVRRQDLTETIRTFGELTASKNHRVTVSAPFAGMLLSDQNRTIPVKGQYVKKGQSLAVLQPAIQSGQGDNYAQQFINAQSDLSLAKAELERSQRLYKQEAIPKAELQKARVKYRQAVTRYQTIQDVVQIDTTEVEMKGSSTHSFQFRLKAPISGFIQANHLSQGMQVEAGQPLYEIVDASKMWLRASVPASKHSQLSNQGRASFRPQGYEQWLDIQELDGKMISRTRSVDPNTRTVDMVFEFDNPSESLPLGMFADVYLDTKSIEHAIAVPESALLEEEGSYFVFVHVSGESFEKRRVTRGIRDRHWVEITSGLEEGEHVVTKNAYQVKLASLSSNVPAHGHSH